MVARLQIPLLLLVCCALLPASLPAAVVFGPSKKDPYRAPGEHEVSGTAQQLFATAQAAESSGNLGRAAKAYRSLVRRFPKDINAPTAAFRFAQIEERTGDHLKAAAAYRVVVEQYPRSPYFDEAIEAQFRIGEMYLAGKKLKLLGVPVRKAIDRSIEIFAAIIRTAPYGKYTARAQFNIGLANEKLKNVEAAVLAYQEVVEKFPDHPIAADAQYQVGYIWFTTTSAGVRDAKAAANAKIGFQDFLFRYPKSEKVAQARENLRKLEQKQTTDAYQIAKFYDKQKNYRAAVIYYNDVIRQQPGSSQGTEAKKRVSELRAKVGEGALQSAALTAATAQKPKPPPMVSDPSEARSSSGSSGGSRMPGTPGDGTPLPPPEYDESLPPPASETPDTTTAPDPAPTPETTP